MALFIVTTRADDGAGSLREAIRLSEATAGADEIRFDEALKPPGPFALPITLRSPLVIRSGEVFINGDADGDGLADAAISGGAFPSGNVQQRESGARLFEVRPGATLTLDSVDLTRGQDYVFPDESAVAVAGLLNEGRATLRNVYFDFLEARVLDRAAGQGGTPDAALIHNAAGAEMVLDSVALSASFVVVGSDGATAEETGAPGGAAVAGVLNDGVLAANLLALAVSAEGGSVTAPGRNGGDAVVGILNRGTLTGIATEGGFDRVIGTRDANAFAGSAADGDAGRALVGAVSGNGEAETPPFLLAVLVGAGGAMPDGDLLTRPAGSRTSAISGRDRNETLIGFDGPDEIFGRGGDDLMLGRGGADTLFADAGRDTLFGGEGDDILLLRPALGGGGGQPTTAEAHGGEGNDRFDVGGVGLRMIDGGPGSDSIAFVGFDGIGYDFDFGVSGPQTVREGLTISAVGVEVLFGSEFDDRLTGLRGGGSVFGASGEDLLTGGAGVDRLVGGPGDDTLRGMAGADRLEGGSGFDRLDGGAGADTLLGGDQSDRLSGRAGSDLLMGEALSDTIIGGGGADMLLGGGGKDSLDGGAGRDRIEGAVGVDTLFGGGGSDTLLGGGGGDELLGGGGADRLIGAGGDDTILGGAGRDMLLGGGGGDILFGGGGTDALAGGAGRDAFVFAPGSGRDRITDYETDRDLIAFLSGPRSLRDLTITQDGADAVIAFDGGQIIVESGRADRFDADDFLFAG